MLRRLRPRTTRRRSSPTTWRGAAHRRADRVDLPLLRRPRWSASTPCASASSRAPGWSARPSRWQYAAQVVERLRRRHGRGRPRALTTVVGDVLALAGELAEHLPGAGRRGGRSPRRCARGSRRCRGPTASGPPATTRTSASCWRCSRPGSRCCRWSRDYTEAQAAGAASWTTATRSPSPPASPAAPRGRRHRARPLRRGAARRVPGHRRGAAGAAHVAVRRRPPGHRGRRPAAVHLRLARRQRRQPRAVPRGLLRPSGRGGAEPRCR